MPILGEKKVSVVLLFYLLRGERIGEYWETV